MGKILMKTTFADWIPMKTTFALLTWLLLVAASTAQAQLTYTVNNGQLTVAGYSGAGAVSIPATNNGMPVVGINGEAFYDNGNITSVAIGSNVTSIGSGAFRDCSLLASVTLPNGLTNLGASAFQSCTNLSAIALPAALSNIADYTFDGCTALTNVLLGNGVTNISQYAFGDCSALPMILLDTNLTVIGADAFSECTGLTNIIIPNSVTNLGAQGFYDCYALESASLGNGLVTMGSQAFFQCYSLSSITIPGSITDFGSDPFDYCYELESVTLASGLTSLPNDAFDFCYSLKSLTIPDTVTNINTSTAVNCYSLTNVVIGNGIGTIPSGAFANCQALAAVTIGSSVSNMSSGSFDECPALRNIIIANGANNIFNDQFEYFTSLTSVTIPDTVTNIGADAFAQCTSLTSVTIPNSVVSIGSQAFDNCTALAFASIGNGVTNIGAQAFSQCTALTSASMGDAVVGVGSSAFQNCYALSNITIPNSVTILGNGVFENCYALGSATLGSGITSILGGTFQGCQALASITIPNTVTILQSGAFSSCPALTNVVIGNGIGTIPTGAFSGCPVLSTVTIGAGVTNMSSSSFSGCPALAIFIITNGASNIFNNEFAFFDALTDVTIPNTVTNIGTNAFLECSSLMSATIPDSVIAIGASAFSQCLALANVTIPDGVQSIGNGAFSGCAVISSIAIPNSVTNLDENAFGGCASLNRVTIGNGVINIGGGAFSSCPSLVSVIISGSVTNVGSDAFENCPSLTGVYFEGNAPSPTNDTTVFQNSTPTVYYFNGATGWGPTFNGRPTMALTPGSLQVTINPPGVVAAGAQWQLDGGPLQASGATLNSLFPISHVISFVAVSNWITPDDMTVTVVSNQTVTAAGAYVAVTGDLQVNINPPGAVTAGAAWQVDGGSNQSSGAILGVPVTVSHTVSFATISGWTAPPDQVITVTNGSTNIISGTYAQEFGALQVTINPPDAISTGALWQLDGGSNFANGATISNLPAGIHTVTFLPVAGFATPAAETVTIAGNQTTVTNGMYILVTNGALQVTITPSGAVAAGAVWQVDGGANQNSGVTLSNLSAGTHLVSFGPAPGWMPPANLFVSITNGDTTMTTGVYTSVPVTKLMLLTNGAGTIRAQFSPQSVAIGRLYTVKAVPATGNIFSKWVGGTSPPYAVFATTASLTFNMQSNLLLEANFVTNLFLAAQGDYTGLFAPGNAARQQDNSGSFGFMLTKTGAVNGKLLIGSRTTTLTGQFEADGSAVITSTPPGGTTWKTTLQLDAANHAVTGTVSNGGFVAQLTGYQNVFSSQHPTPNAGAYTLIIPGVSDPATGPGGVSYGTVTVSSSGVVTFAGNLADGTLASQSSAVSASGFWPLYINLYGGAGSLWGWNYFSNKTVTAAPALSWINETNSSKTAAYRAGFTNQNVALTGSSYDSSVTLPTGPAVAILEGTLASPITNALTIAAQNKISLANPTNETDHLTLTVNKKTGVISGSFANPANSKQTIKVNGVILQDQTNASGYFLNNGQSGVFTLTPQ